MEKKTLFIHIGPHKTGSTTIQSILDEEKDTLLGEGILYLGFFYDIVKKIKKGGEIDEDLIYEFRQQVGEKINQHKDKNVHTYITSNERYAGENMIVYKNAPFFAETLRKVFEPFDFNIKIIAFLRRQDKFFESLYTQKIKGGDSFSFQEYLDSINDIYDLHWDSFLESFSNVFGKKNIIAKRFGRQYLHENHNLIQVFGEVINSPYLKNYSKKNFENRRYSRDITEIVRLSNPYLNNEEERVFRKILSEVDLPKGNNVFFTLQERKKLLAHYEESNRRVAHAYFNDAEGELFLMDDLHQNNIENTYTGLTLEAVTVSLTKIIIAQHQQLSEKVKRNSEMVFSRMIRRKIRNLFGKRRQ